VERSNILRNFKNDYSDEYSEYIVCKPVQFNMKGMPHWSLGSLAVNRKYLSIYVSGVRVAKIPTNLIVEVKQLKKEEIIHISLGDTRNKCLKCKILLAGPTNIITKIYESLAKKKTKT